MKSLFSWLSPLTSLRQRMTQTALPCKDEGIFARLSPLTSLRQRMTQTALPCKDEGILARLSPPTSLRTRLRVKQSRALLCLAVCVVSSLFTTACTSHPSVQQTMVDDRFMVYTEMYKAYAEAEKNYLNLLFNIERMPEEEELWIMKRDRMLELLQLRELMLSSRAELDDAVKDWETHLSEVQGEVQAAKIKQYNPNFTGRDAKRTSPGQLLPEEAMDSKRR